MSNNTSFTKKQPEDELVQAARTSREALGQLFDQFYPTIFAYCFRRLIVRAIAEDVTSEVFLHVAVGIQNFSGQSTEDFRRWLFRIATNEINAQLRKSIRRQELFEEAAKLGKLSQTNSLTNEKIDWQSIYSALGELSEEEQAIISLKFFSNQKHEEIGNILQLKAGTVRVKLSRALGKLRDLLQISFSPPDTHAQRGASKHESE